MRDMLTHKLPEEVRRRLALDPEQMIEAGFATQQRGYLLDARRSPLELRAAAPTTEPGDAGEPAEPATFGAVGYAATWEVPYEVYGGPPWGWIETIAAGAVTKSLAERDDVRFLLNHDGLALARTASGTMSLTADDIGLKVDVPAFDMENPRAAELYSTLNRRDVDQMSWAFQVIRQEWNGDYTERRILEVRIFDVSAVTFPANPATIIGARADTDRTTSRSFPLSLAVAQAAALG